MRKLVFWNYFEFCPDPPRCATLVNRGVATADLYVALAGSGAKIPPNASGAFDFAAGGWKRVRAGHAFRKAPVARTAADTIAATDAIDLADCRNVTHVALVGMKHFGPDAYGKYVGFSEAQILLAPGTYVERPDSARAQLRAAIRSDGRLDKLLFLRRYTYQSSHIYTDHYDGSTMRGGNLCVLSPVAPDGKVTELVPTLREGIIGNYDLSFDAKRIALSYKPAPNKGYRIFEAGGFGS